MMDNFGRRIVCPHPSEYSTVEKVLGEKASRETIEQRTGFNSFCLCLDCMENLKIDLKRDERICPHCSSNRVLTVDELVDNICPKCGEGTIEKIEFGVS